MIFPITFGFLILTSGTSPNLETDPPFYKWMTKQKSVSSLKSQRDVKPDKLLLVSNSSENDSEAPKQNLLGETQKNSNTAPIMKNQKETTQIPNPEPEIQNQSNTTQNSEIETLKQFTQEKTALEIHNKALQFLKSNQEAQALLLLKKNAYQNLFPPSYLTLLHLETPIALTPLLWQIGLFFTALICLFFLVASLKKLTPTRLKLLCWSLCLFGGLIFSGVFLLKKRVGVIQDIELRTLPFKEAPVQITLRPHSDLIVLKPTDLWLRIQTPDKETGWVPKHKVFQTF